MRGFFGWNFRTGLLIGIIWLLGSTSDRWREPALRTAPRRDASLVMDLQGSDWGPSSVGVSAVHACQGKYVDVTAITPTP